MMPMQLYGLQFVRIGRPCDDCMLALLPSHDARANNTLPNFVSLALQSTLQTVSPMMHKSFAATQQQT